MSTGSTVLDGILATTRDGVVGRRSQRSLALVEAEAAASGPVRPFAAALRAGAGVRGPRAIAEFKRRSPSAGWIREGARVVDVARAYQAAGAAALSILTEGPSFGGELADLAAARGAVGVPLLRKDFLVDPYQVFEARAAGADAVLLILMATGDGQAGELLAAVREAGLEALVECHDEAEVDRALALGAGVIGVNNRNLRTMAVDTGLAPRLRARVPRDRVFVAESGLRTPADLEPLRAVGVDAILVGEGLMRAPDPGRALAELLA